MIAIFDLDGTLTNNEHRQHFLEENPKNWKAFNEACGDDKPNWPIIKTLQMFNDGNDYVFILSGRSLDVHRQTIDWLKKYKIDHCGLYMRNIGDYRDDREIKRGFWVELNRLADPKFTKDNTIIFDDRQKVVDMWREMGLTCCQVAPGNF